MLEASIGLNLIFTFTNGSAARLRVCVVCWCMFRLACADQDRGYVRDNRQLHLVLYANDITGRNQQDVSLMQACVFAVLRSIGSNSGLSIIIRYSAFACYKSKPRSISIISKTLHLISQPVERPYGRETHCTFNTLCTVYSALDVRASDKDYKFSLQTMHSCASLWASFGALQKMRYRLLNFVLQLFALLLLRHLHLHLLSFVCFCLSFHSAFVLFFCFSFHIFFFFFWTEQFTTYDYETMRETNIILRWPLKYKLIG